MNNAPNAGIGDAATVCNNAAVTLSLTELLSGADSGGIWALDSGTPDAGAFDATAATFNTDGHSPGVFTFSYTLSANAPCADATSVVSITIEDCNCATPATPTAMVDSVAVCAGTLNTAAFVAVPAPNTAIVWYNGSNPTTADSLASGNNYVPAVAGTYYAVAYNIPSDACFSAALPFILTENPMPSVAFTANADTACVGETLTFVLTGAASASATYTWNFGANAIPLTATGSTATAQWNAAGMPEVLLTANDNDCVADTSLSIAISNVEASISPAEATLYNGGSVVLQVSANSGLDGAVNYEWITAAGLSCTDCAAPTAQPAQTTLYTVQVSDDFGCVAEASALVSIIVNNVIVVPNAFSPNGDGNNDVFRLQGTNVKTITLYVYNRWGNNIYTATGDLNSVSWDGSYDNAAVEIGVYVFQADITYQDGKTEMLKGNITVVR